MPNQGELIHVCFIIGWLTLLHPKYVQYFFPQWCVIDGYLTAFAGVAPSVGSSHGPQNEQAQQQQSQHAEGGAADESPLAPQHTQVRLPSTPK